LNLNQIVVCRKAVLERIPYFFVRQQVNCMGLKNYFVPYLAPSLVSNREAFNIELPCSKSLFLRYLVYAALAEGVSTLKHATLSEDAEDMINALQALGVIVEVNDDVVTVHGVNGRLPGGDRSVELRLSGVTARFVVALAALRCGTTRIDGLESLRKRPLGGIIAAIKQLGVKVEGESLPIVVSSIGGDALRIGNVIMSGEVSSQYLSAMLAIAPCLSQDLSITIENKLVSLPYVIMSIASMKDFGIAVNYANAATFKVSPQKYQARTIAIEPDASAASYFAAMATLHGVQVHLRGVALSTLQGDIGFMDICKRLGSEVCETTSGLSVKGPEKGIMNPLNETLDFEAMPDVAPTFFALAPFIPGGAKASGIQTLRVKECNRITAPQSEYVKVGVSLVDEGDIVSIEEQLEIATKVVTVATYDDHRMAMSLAVFGSKLPNGIFISDPDCTAKTFPDFWEQFNCFYIPVSKKK
jgi:3-phosphoshikimate 1-carboxyvinyltransferase